MTSDQITNVIANDTLKKLKKDLLQSLSCTKDELKVVKLKQGKTRLTKENRIRIICSKYDPEVMIMVYFTPKHTEIELSYFDSSYERISRNNATFNEDAIIIEYNEFDYYNKVKLYITSIFLSLLPNAVKKRLKKDGVISGLSRP